MLDYPANHSVSLLKLLCLMSVQQKARNHSNNQQHNLSPPFNASGFFRILALENVPDKNNDVDDDVLSVKSRLVHLIVPFLVLFHIL